MSFEVVKLMSTKQTGEILTMKILLFSVNCVAFFLSIDAFNFRTASQRLNIPLDTKVIWTALATGVVCSQLLIAPTNADVFISASASSSTVTSMNENIKTKIVVPPMPAQDIPEVPLLSQLTDNLQPYVDISRGFKLFRYSLSLKLSYLLKTIYSPFISFNSVPHALNTTTPGPLDTTSLQGVGAVTRPSSRVSLKVKCEA